MNKFSGELVESLTEACEQPRASPAGSEFMCSKSPMCVPSADNCGCLNRDSPASTASRLRRRRIGSRDAASRTRQRPPISKSLPSAPARRGKRWRLEGGAPVLRPFALHDRDHRQLLV